jgi:hypothetical protein
MLQRWAVWGLAQTGMPDAVPVLAEVASSSPDPDVTQQALQGLARLSHMVRADEGARLSVLRAANAAESRFGARQEIRNLASLLREGLAYLPDYVAILEDCARGDDAAATHNALCWTGDRMLGGVQDSMVRERAMEAVARLVDSETAALRLRALWYLGCIADPFTAGLMAETARTHPDRATRLLAVWALWRTDRKLFEETFQPMPAHLLTVTPSNWREVRDRAAALGEPDLEIQRLIADLWREDGP